MVSILSRLVSMGRRLVGVMCGISIIGVGLISRRVLKRTLDMSLGNVAVVPSCMAVLRLLLGSYCVSRVNISKGIGSVVVSIRSVVVCMSSSHVAFASVGLGRGPLGGLRRAMGLVDGSMRGSVLCLLAVVHHMGPMNISLCSVRICLSPVFLSSGIVDVCLCQVSLRMGAVAICLFVMGMLSLTMGIFCESMLMSRIQMSNTVQI